MTLDKNGEGFCVGGDNNKNGFGMSGGDDDEA